MKTWTVIANTGKQADLESGLEKRAVEKPANISAQGGLVSLSVELDRPQTLLITNLQTNEDLACRAARLGKTAEGKILVGVEFLRPSPNFWSIEFKS